MAAARITVTIPADILDAVRQTAAATGESVSGWVEAAIQARMDLDNPAGMAAVRHERLAQFNREMEAEFGPVPQSALDYVDSVWPE